MACSGGADSTALARVLAALGHPLELVYVDHRSHAASGEHGAWVAALGRALDAPSQTLVVPGGTARSEAAWRQARYTLLHCLAGGDTPIAVGHTLDDQAETVLLRLLRGAGTAGLAGIPVRRGRVVRPLLGLRRAENERYLRAVGQAWLEDPSNASPEFARNRVRQRVLPVLAEESPRVVEHLAALASVARAEREVLEASAAAHLALHGLNLAALRALASGLQAQVVRAACPASLSVERTQALLRYVEAGRGGRLELGGKVVAHREGHGAAARLVFEVGEDPPQ